LPVDFNIQTVRYIQTPIGGQTIQLGTAPPSNRRHEFYEFSYSDNNDQGYGELDFVRTPMGAEYNYRYELEGTGLAPNLAGTNQIAQENRIYRKTIVDDTSTPSTLEWDFQYDWSWTNITNPDVGIIFIILIQSTMLVATDMSKN